MAASGVRVSFFVQAYNTAAYVGECLESVLNQRGNGDFEVLLIDDASTDGTAQEATRFRDPRLRIVRHDHNAGAIATANEGYAACGGRFVVRIDSDDRLRPDFLRQTVPFLERHADVGLVYGDVAMIDAGGQITCAHGVVRRPDVPSPGNEFLPLLLENYVPAPATIVRREALAPLLPIPAAFRFLDWYITTGIAEQWKSVYVDDVLAEYRVHSENMHRAMISDRSGEATSLQVLDRLFARPVRAEEKRRWRRRVYASCYLTYAEKYFGAGMNRDALRCYRRAGGLQPRLLLKPQVARHVAGLLIGRRLYDAFKVKTGTIKPRPSSLLQ